MAKQVDEKALLARCQKAAGAKEKWTTDNLSGFFHRYRPQGVGLEQLYEDVPFGAEIVKRLKEVMKVDGTDRGLSLSVNHPRAIDAAKAGNLVRKFFANMRKLGKELNEADLIELFPPTLKFVPQAGKLNRYRANSLTEDALCVVCEVAEEGMSSCRHARSPARVMHEAIYTLVYDFPLLYYIQWPIYADCFETKDPFKPWFDMWRSQVKWRLVKGSAVEVFLP